MVSLWLAISTIWCSKRLDFSGQVRSMRLIWLDGFPMEHFFNSHFVSNASLFRQKETIKFLFLLAGTPTA